MVERVVVLILAFSLPVPISVLDPEQQTIFVAVSLHQLLASVETNYLDAEISSSKPSKVKTFKHVSYFEDLWKPCAERIWCSRFAGMCCTDLRLVRGLVSSGGTLFAGRNSHKPCSAQTVELTILLN